jgi:hypothetical protein
MLNSSDAERFARIERETGLGYGITLKDLAWLVRLVVKLEKAFSSQPSALSEQPKAAATRKKR